MGEANRTNIMKESSIKGHLIHVEVHKIKLSLSFEPSSKKDTFIFIRYPIEKQIGRFGRLPTHGMAWLENPSIFFAANFGVQDQEPN